MSLRSHVVKNYLNILKEDEVKRIHYGALEVLERTGVIFKHKKALAILGDAGCAVDLNNERVRFPNYLVEESLKKCPRRVLLKGATPEYDVVVGDPYVHFSNCLAMNTLNLETMDTKVPTVQDHINMNKVLDYLDQVHLIYGPYVEIAGYDEMLYHPGRYHITVQYSSKPSITAGVFGNEIWTIQIAKAVSQNPIGTVVCAPPLTWAEDKIDGLLNYVEAGFPIWPGTGLALGMTSPVTIAGALVQQQAEILSGIVLAQVVKPGAPVIAKCRVEMADMRSGLIAEGGVEKSIANAAFNQIWRWYQIPTAHTIVSTDSKMPDYQCGMEKALHMLLSAWSGSNIIAGIGGVYDEMTASPVVAIMDNELVRQVFRIMDGVEVNEETLALDLINEVGPIPGEFLSRAHTRRWWKSELLVPNLVDRASLPEWVAGGKNTFLDYAKKKYDEIIATHNPKPLPENKIEEINEIMDEARQFYKTKG